MSAGPPSRRRGMATNQIHQLRALEGHRVGLAVRGGRRIDDCDLVSVGRAGARSLWVFADGSDVFVPFDDVVDVWEAA